MTEYYANSKLRNMSNENKKTFIYDNVIYSEHYAIVLNYKIIIILPDISKIVFAKSF